MSTNDNDHLPQNQHESNRNLVNYLCKNGFIKSPLVRDAFLAVDRKWYAPVDPYSNVPQILGDQSTISAPSMHARAVELLLPFLLPMSSTHSQELGLISVSGISGRPRRILDIGSGSGFLVHIFSTIAGKTGKVLGFEHVEPLRSLGESNMLMSPGGAALLASGRAPFRLGDRRYGWKEPNSDDKPASDDDGCWDVIHVGAAAVELPLELVRK